MRTLIGRTESYSDGTWRDYDIVEDGVVVMRASMNREGITWMIIRAKDGLVLASAVTHDYVVDLGKDQLGREPFGQEW